MSNLIHSSRFKLINSMIPDILDNGVIKSSNMAEVRAIKNGIVFNSLNNNVELRNLISLSKRILSLENLELEQLLYDKLEYLGFTPKKVEIKVDMSFREKTIYFCGNFMLLHNEGNMDKFLSILNKLND